MQEKFEYRGYVVFREGEVYVATERESDPDDGSPILKCGSLISLLRAIDQLWNALESRVIPAWFASWLESQTAYLIIDQKVVQLPEKKLPSGPTTFAA